jgi:hypothetical protein
MQIDARPFRAKYSAAFLSKKYHEKIATKRQIARAYLAGADLKELAEEYSLSIQKIMSIANWYDRERAAARRLAKVIAPEPVQVEEPSQAQEDPQRLGTYTIDILGTLVTLPLLSIQKRNDAV